MEKIVKPIKAISFEAALRNLASRLTGTPVAELPRTQEAIVQYMAENVPTPATGGVNVDELDYLAKRLDSFSEGENIKFEAMASKLNLSSIRDFINLTFCCQRATVITDFSDLERIGKVHALTVSGESMPVEAFERLDYRAVALDLIQRAPGMVNPLRRGVQQRHEAGAGLRWAALSRLSPPNAPTDDRTQVRGGW